MRQGSLRASDGVNYSDPQEQSSINTFREYNERLVATAEASDGYLRVADWASNGASEWFEADGVHLTARGVDAVTNFIAATVQRVLAGENVSPAAAPWTVLVPGAEGEIVTDSGRRPTAPPTTLFCNGHRILGADRQLIPGTTRTAAHSVIVRTAWPAERGPGCRDLNYYTD